MKFAVGEIAELYGLTRNINHNGLLVEIISLPKETSWIYPGLGVYSKSPIHIPAGRYLIKEPTGYAHTYERNLKKLPGDSIPASTLALFTKKKPNLDKAKEKA